MQSSPTSNAFTVQCDVSHVRINKHDILNRKMSHSYYRTKINLGNTNYNNLWLILTASPLLPACLCMYGRTVSACVFASVTFFSCFCLNRQSLRYSLQNSAHAILISHQNMEAGAPTPSLSPYIIDYARLQISLEKVEEDTERKREKHVETKRKRQREKEELWNDPVISAL